MPTREQYRELINDSLLEIDNKGREVCPLTGKPPTDSRCAGQLDLRMMTAKKACEEFCGALYDELSVERFGGFSSANLWKAEITKIEKEVTG